MLFRSFQFVGNSSLAGSREILLSYDAMLKAEEIAKQNKKHKMVVISGVGVREYYKKLGYQNDGPYVSKIL